MTKVPTSTLGYGGKVHLFRTIAGLAIMSAASLSTPGCAPTIDLFTSETASQEQGSGYNDQDWATVLRENIKEGLVDYAHLSSHADPLDRYLALVAAIGPETAPQQFGSTQARLAYCLNVYNAGVLKAVLVAGMPGTMHDVRGPRLEQDYRIRVDGRITSLGKIQETVRDLSADDVRVELALCDACRGAPPLFAEPFRAQSLDEQLHRVCQDAMGNPLLVNIDHERERLNIGVVLSQNRERFIDFYLRQTGSRRGTMLSALLHLADGARREWLNTAVGYQIGTIPLDRELNRWPRTGGGMAVR